MLLLIVEKSHVGFGEIPQSVEADEAEYGYHIAVGEGDDGLVAHPMGIHSKECGVVFHTVDGGFLARLDGYNLVLFVIRNGHPEDALHRRRVIGIGVVAEEVAPTLHGEVVVERNEVLKTLISHAFIARRGRVIYLVALRFQQAIGCMVDEIRARLDSFFHPGHGHTVGVMVGECRLREAIKLWEQG